MQPKSIRLNQDLRNDFISTVVHEVMPTEKEPTLDKFKNENAQAIYDATYGPHLELMNQLPAWMLKKATCFGAQLGTNATADTFVINSAVTTFYGDGQTVNSRYHNHDIDCPTPVLKDDHPITKKLVAYRQSIKDWSTKRQELHKQLRELTNNCNTTGQLFKTWPKAMEFAHVFPEAQVKERAVWEPSMDAAELDLGVELSQVDVAPIEEN